MKFQLKKAIEILEKTPAVLESFLSGLSGDWLKNNEGDNTWTPYDVVGHLIHGEKTDWTVRAGIILSEKEDKSFIPFDRFAQLKEDKEYTIDELLEEFRDLRTKNLDYLNSLNITEKDFDKKGIHPELGEANLQQLLASWVVHDLGHISQIARVMAKQYQSEVGPWTAYLGILK
jgi:hypothetical protein